MRFSAPLNTIFLVIYSEYDFNKEVYANAVLKLDSQENKTKGRRKMKETINSIFRFIRRNKVMIRSLCFVLSLIMVFYVIPSTIFAKAAEALEDTNTEATSTPTTDESKNEVSGIAPFEVVELREEYAKHFRLSDGSYVAAQYNYPVHSLDENGEWQDIDNALSKNGSEFTNENARIKFAKKINGSATLFTLHDGNTKITLNLIGAEKGTKGTVTNGSDTNETNELEKMMNLEKLSATILYEDILDGVDLEYVAYSMNVKENIIVKERKDSYSYSFELKLNGLTPTLTESGDIKLTDDDTGEVKYVFPAPIVFDANGVYAPSDMSSYSLVHENGKKYILTVTASGSWMNSDERAFPITIDPPVKQQGSSVIDVNINSANPTVQTNDVQDLTVMDNNHTMLIHWKMTSLPTVPTSARITEAYVSLCLKSGYGAYVGAYEVLKDWDSTLTWEAYKSRSNPQGSTLTNLVDYQQMTFPGYYDWNITELAIKWYRDSYDNFGVAFGSVKINTTSATFYSNETANKPALTVVYRDMKGLESYLPYSSHSAGIAGNGNVNLANGNLVFTIPTLTTTDNIFSYTPYLTYDSSLSKKFYYADNANVGITNPFLGTGFKLSVNETLMTFSRSAEDGTEVYYVYSDPDGTEHYFASQDDGTYRDEDGLGLILTVESSGDISIKTPSKEIKRFEKVSHADFGTRWRLTETVDINGNKLIYTYENVYYNLFKPLKISLLPNKCDTAIELLEFCYHDTTGKLIMVYNSASKMAVVFRYSNSYNSAVVSNGYQYMRQIDYAVGTSAVSADNWYAFALNEADNTNINVYDSAKYNYDSYGRLIEAVNVKNNTSIKYTWNSANNKVSTVSEYAGTSIGNTLSFLFRTDSTVVQSNGNDGSFGTLDDIKNCYILDKYGRCTAMYSTSRDGEIVYGASSYSYDTQSNSKNSVNQSAILGDHATNYIINGSFEDRNGNYPSHWLLDGNSSLTNITNINGSFEKSVTLRATENFNAGLYQNLVLIPDTYTLSFPLYAIRGKDMRITVTIRDYSTNAVIHSTEIEPIPNYGETFFSTTFTIDGSYNKNVTLEIRIFAPSDSDEVHIIEIDSIMLSRGVGANNFNFVEYGGFEESLLGTNGEGMPISTDYWYDQDGNAINVKYIGTTFEREIGLTNEDGGERYIKQIVYNADTAKLMELDENGYSSESHLPHTFAVSGFAQVYRSAIGKPMRLIAEVVYYKGAGVSDVTEKYYFNFITDNEDLQFTSGSFTLGYAQDGTPIDDYLGIKSIAIYCDCSFNYNARANFDNVSVTYIGINAVTSYTYNEDGNPSSVVRGADGQFYEYDNKGNVVIVADNNGKMLEYLYDVTYTDRVRSIIEYSFTCNGTTNYPYRETEARIEKTYKMRTDFVYNDYGMVITEQICELTPSGARKIDGALVITNYTYNTNPNSKIFGALLTESNALNTNRYFYDESTGWLLASVNLDTGDGYAYRYDGIGRLVQVDLAYYTTGQDYAIASNSQHVTYEYDANNRLSGISTGETDYVLTYDKFGNTESVGIGDIVLAEYEYKSNNGKIKRVIYGNGYEVEYAYNDLELLSSTKYKTSESSEYITAYEYKYTSRGQVYFIKDYVAGRITLYKYDADGKMLGYKEYTSTDHDTLIETDIAYDDNDRISNVTNTFAYGSIGAISTDTLNSAYTYLSDGKLSSYTVSGNFNSDISYSYDTLDRILQVVYNNSDGSNSVEIFTEYDYLTSDIYGDTSLVETFTSTVVKTTTTYTYTYDANGNITKITYSDGNVIEYEYDDLGQLISEVNGVTGKSYVYYYDNAGNIIEVTGETKNQPGHTLDSWYYSDSDWGDLLTSFNGTAITYDDIGNPLSYYNGNSYTFGWRGRRLISAVKGADYMSFAYNEAGLRISKTVNGVTTHYVYDGDVLLAEYTDSEAIVYIYDAYDKPIGFKYRSGSYASDEWDIYWYEKNLQGDIVSILSSAGTTLVSYTYNAWGVTSKTYSNGGASTTAANNNLTYRGYYYDTDLGMYYLQSRYYDPAICRFINADGYISTGQGFTGYNMFAYCGNNPVMRVDRNGEGWILAVILIGVIALTLASCSSSSNTSPRYDLANAPDLDVSTASPGSYNCYGNAIGKQIATNPTGYQRGDSTRKVFEAVKNDLGSDNVRELSSINDPIGEDEFKVAIKCASSDYHFIRLDDTGWYNKSGLAPGLYIDQSIVENDIWFAMWMNGNQCYYSPPYYNDETIYFAVRKGWDD